MPIEITEDHAFDFTEYASVPIAFEARERFDIVMPEGGLGGMRLVERRLEAPYRKDYDTDPASHPRQWPARFDTSHWGLLTARNDGHRIGGAVIAWRTAGLDMLEGRTDLAVLWDLRVAPAMRGRGVGSALFDRAAAWAAVRDARWLKVETQNVNPVACRFYANRGCTLGAIDRFAYPALPDEVQLLWYKKLDRPSPTHVQAHDDPTRTA